MTWNEAAAAVESIRGLPDDWDGQGSPGVRNELVEAAKLVLVQLQLEGFIAPDRIRPA